MTECEKVHVSIYGPAGQEGEGTIQIREEGDEFVLRLDSLLITATGTGETIFEALQRLRENIEDEGLRVQCAGTSIDVYPSPMMMAMGDGRQAYRLTPRVPARADDIVDIFDRDPAWKPCTVAEQRAFYDLWFESISNNHDEPDAPRNI